MSSQTQLSFPRPILKWMQTLNLSVKIRDLRRDFSSGFIFAEILSRYFPSMVYLNKFQNHSSKADIDDNWTLLRELFAKVNFQVKDLRLENVRSGNWNSQVLFLQ